MTGITTDPNDLDLGHGGNDTPVPQNKKYLVLSEEERGKGFIRPYRDSYKHEVCGSITTMGRAISETYARNPYFYGATYCVNCSMHKPVGEDGEFIWLDGSKVGT